MTDLQLMLMERADKTLSFGCMVGCDIIVSYTISSTDKTREGKYFTAGKMYRSEEKCKKEGIIGHPYGFERLMRLYKENLYNMLVVVDGILTISKYLDNNTNIYDKPCIDRPEEGQKLVLDFLLTLPK